MEAAAGHCGLVFLWHGPDRFPPPKTSSLAQWAWKYSVSSPRCLGGVCSTDTSFPAPGFCSSFCVFPFSHHCFLSLCPTPCHASLTCKTGPSQSVKSKNSSWASCFSCIPCPLLRSKCFRHLHSQAGKDHCTYEYLYFGNAWLLPFLRLALLSVGYLAFSSSGSVPPFPFLSPSLGPALPLPCLSPTLHCWLFANFKPLRHQGHPLVLNRTLFFDLHGTLKSFDC